MLHKIPRSNKSASLGALFLLYVYWAPYLAMGTFMMYANVAGTSKKVVVFALVYIAYCTGNLIAPQTFLAKEAPTYSTAIVVMLVGYIVSLLLIIAYGFVCWRDNKKKVLQQAEWEREHAGEAQGVIGDEWRDLTDKKVSWTLDGRGTKQLTAEPGVPVHLVEKGQGRVGEGVRIA